MALEIVDVLTLGMRIGFLVGLVGTLTILTYYAARWIPDRFRGLFKKTLVLVAVMYCGIFAYWAFIYEYLYFGKSLQEIILNGVATGNLLYLAASAASLIMLPLSAGKGFGPQAHSKQSVLTAFAEKPQQPTKREVSEYIMTSIPRAEVRSVVLDVLQNPTAEIENMVFDLLKKAKQFEQNVVEETPQSEKPAETKKKPEETFLIRREQR
jgi:hypothetical protein